MRRYAGRSLILAVGLLALPLLSAHAQPLTKTELVQRGKAAVALVESPGLPSNAATCLHPSGLFVTYSHPQLNAKDGVALVLNPNTPMEKSFKARVILNDAKDRFAFLQVDGVKDLPSLPLGDANKLEELMDMYTFGFSGRAKGEGKERVLPPVGVHIGRLTAIQRANGAAVGLEVDGSSPARHIYGSPVLDDHGRLVALRVGPGSAKGLGEARTVDVLKDLLARPKFEFTPPKLTKAGLDKPLDLTLKATPFLPGTPAPTVELTLDGDPPRTLHLKRKGDEYQLSVVPRPAGAGMLEVRVEQAGGTLQGQTPNRTFTVGKKKFQLSEVAGLRFQPKPFVSLKNGKAEVGAIGGLDELPIKVGEQTLNVKTAGATELFILGTPPPLALNWTFVAKLDGKVVGRLDARVPVVDQPVAPPVNLSKAKVTPLTKDQDLTSKALPGPTSDMAIGGAGRYLVFHFPSLKRVGVYDVPDDRFLHLIPVDDDNVVICAGLEKLIVGQGTKKTIQRFDLASGKLEQTLKEFYGNIVMGSASRGPVASEGRLLDLETLKVLDIKGQGGVGGKRQLASSGGLVFGAWQTNFSPGYGVVFALDGSVLSRVDGGECGHVYPGPDGKYIFTANGIRTRNFSSAGPGGDKAGYCLPAVQGDYFLSLKPNTGAAIGVVGHAEMLANYPKLHHGLNFDGWDRNEYPVVKHVAFLPQTNVMIVLTPGKDRLEFHKLDMGEILKTTPTDYLFMDSAAPLTAKRGEVYRYAPAVKSKKGDAKLSIEIGPPGLIVTKDAALEWRVPADFTPGRVDVLFRARDGSKREASQLFTIEVK